MAERVKGRGRREGKEEREETGRRKERAVFSIGLVVCRSRYELTMYVGPPIGILAKMFPAGRI